MNKYTFKATTAGWENLVAIARYDIRELAKLHCVSARQLLCDYKLIVVSESQDWLNEQRLVAAMELLVSGAFVKRVAWIWASSKAYIFASSLRIIA